MNKKILLVDDDADELDILVEALKVASIKYDCVRADSADKALASLDSINPDIIFLDINLPRMNGLDCLKHIRKMDSYINTPVIMYSTGLNGEIQAIAESFGASACIKKPYTLADLSKSLSNLFYTLSNQPNKLS